MSVGQVDALIDIIRHSDSGRVLLYAKLICPEIGNAPRTWIPFFDKVGSNRKSMSLWTHTLMLDDVLLSATMGLLAGVGAAGQKENFPLVGQFSAFYHHCADVLREREIAEGRGGDK